MDPAAALAEPRHLTQLVEQLETSAKRQESKDDLFARVLAAPSPLDPGTDVVFVVAQKAPSAHGSGAEDRWLNENGRRLDQLLRDDKTDQCTVIFPGAWPPQPVTRRRRKTKVRLISAVDYLWVDKLRLHKDGHRDEIARVRLLKSLVGSFSSDDERRYTAPALRAEHRVDGSDHNYSRAEDARQKLIAQSPDILVGGVTALFGPGGIGKTYFLRRVADRMCKAAINNPSVGIPTFASLPTLLHADALENWLEHNGIILPNRDIRVLVSEGVVIPLLDALDELVRGQAREGSRDFARRLSETARGNGRVVLSSRDYYLNLDPLVMDSLVNPDDVFLTMGYFGKEGRRRYVQIAAELDEAAAARWANQLEHQAVEALGGLPGEADSLIGHPLFLEAFCAFIRESPRDEGVVDPSTFRLTSPDIFGQIVARVLDREHTKFSHQWDEKFSGMVVNDPWTDPLSPSVQLQVFQHLVLKVAADGGQETARREQSDRSFRQLRHGLFTFTRDVPSAETSKATLKGLLLEVMGSPELADGVDPEIATEAEADLVEAYLQHPVTDTRSGLPEELIHATRHRAYFDYLLADALLGQLNIALAELPSGGGVDLIMWCLEHHIFEHDSSSGAPPFSSCLDFVLWHRNALADARQRIAKFVEAAGPQVSADFDPAVASYIVSLAVALLLRYQIKAGGVPVADVDLSLNADWDLELVPDVVPVVMGLRMERCSLPSVSLSGVEVVDVEVLDCDLAGLRFRDVSVRNSSIVGDCSRLTLEGRVRFRDSAIRLEGLARERVAISGGKVTFRNCDFSPSLADILEETERFQPHLLELVDCRRTFVVTEEAQTSGRRFVNRVLSLMRKHGHDEFAVFGSKLRGLSGLPDDRYFSALRLLERHGAVTVSTEMVYLTEEASRHWISASTAAEDEKLLWWKGFLEDFESQAF